MKEVAKTNKFGATGGSKASAGLTAFDLVIGDRKQVQKQIETVCKKNAAERHIGVGAYLYENKHRRNVKKKMISFTQTCFNPILKRVRTLLV